MLTKYFDSAFTLERLRSGPSGPFIGGFAEKLREAGYARQTIRGHLSVAAHLGHWAEERGLTIAELDEDVGRSFGSHLPSCECRQNPGKYLGQAAASVRLFLNHLREVEAVVPPRLKRPQEGPHLLTTFRDWMLDHRGVTESTLSYYGHVIRDLLSHIEDDPGRLNTPRLRAFVLQRTQQAGHPKQVTTAVRMFVRYLIVEGKCRPGLDAAVPTVAQWRLSALPRYLAASDVERVLAACDPSTENGYRDQAVVLLLARLGLRGGDVVGLRLDDIDWQKATIRLSGKGRHETRLPLTQEIGDAILTYIERGRPRVRSSHVFIRAIAPLGPFSDSSAVSKIVKRAMARAGINTSFRGAHVLRHSAATAMLRKGISLQGIGTVLRHRSLETTAHYAKVDVSLLQQVVQPWPEERSC